MAKLISQSTSTSPRAEFDRLLKELLDAYGEAVVANFADRTDYQQCLDKAACAQTALIKAVFP